MYIQNGEIIGELDTVHSAYGGFYMQPNEEFYISNFNDQKLCKSTDYVNQSVKFGTQFAKMLINYGELLPKFQKEWKSKYVKII